MRLEARWFRRIPWLGILSIALFTFLLAMVVFSFRYLRGKIFPGISISGIPVGSLSPFDARHLLEQRTDSFLQQPIVLSLEDHQWKVDLSTIKFRYELETTVDGAFGYGRGKGIFSPFLLFRSVWQGENIPLQYSFDGQALEASLSAVSSALDLPSIPPSIHVLDRPDPKTGSSVVVEKGEIGQRVDVSALRRELHQRFLEMSTAPIGISIQPIQPRFGDTNLDLIKTRAEHLLSKRAVLSYSQSDSPHPITWELSGKDLIDFLSFSGGFDQEKIASYSAMLAQSINRPAQNATFVFKDGRVTQFAPERNGLLLREKGAVERLNDAFLAIENGEQNKIEVSLPVLAIPPAITVADVNSLGIKELLGRGVSTFHGSIANRKHNIALASSRISGVLVPPQETFSFNTTVGDISALTGYRQAYIIKDGQTVLDDGGGVCQVSTTLFRAILDAGLPILEWHSHSYRVGYYEQNSKAGFDATVFSPSADLKFLNDTPLSLLIQTSIDNSASQLSVEIYGTADGRATTISNYRMWDVTPPPPDLYQDDPSLALGTIKQVDWKAWGAKVKFDYQVMRNGAVLFEKTFSSTYRPWQSVFLRGTGG